jgi:hypothetical protein
MSRPRFNSQFRFGQDGKLAGRFGLNVPDDLIAGIDEFRASAPTSRGREWAQRERRVITESRPARAAWTPQSDVLVR